MLKRNTFSNNDDLEVEKAEKELKNMVITPSFQKSHVGNFSVKDIKFNSEALDNSTPGRIAIQQDVSTDIKHISDRISRHIRQINKEIHSGKNLADALATNETKRLALSGKIEPSKPQLYTQKEYHKTKRSIRQIQDDVKSKLQRYKEDEQLRNELIERVQANRAEQQHSKIQNQITKISVPKTKDDHDEHIKEVIDRRNMFLEAKRELAEKKIADKKQLVGSYKSDKLKAKEELALFDQRRKWIALILIASRISQFQQRLLQDQHEEFDRIRKFQAAITIQRFWKKYLQKDNEQKKTNAFFVIARLVRNYLPSLRRRLKRDAADQIIDFFGEENNKSRLLKIIKKYRFNVITAQHAIRDYFLIKQARIKLISLQWEKLQSTWWQFKMKEQNGSKISQRMKRIGKNGESEVSGFKVPESIKRDVITNNLMERRKKYLKDLGVHLSKLKQWREKNGQKRVMMKALMINEHQVVIGKENEDVLVDGIKINKLTGEPYRMMFRTLLKEKEMFSLMDEAFRLTTDKR